MSLAGIFAFLASSALWRFRVGRSGSSAEGGVLAVSAVVVSGVRRFMVGRSGSSAGVEPVSAGVLDAVVDVPEPDVSEVRRFMVGRSGSPLVDVVDVVVSGLLWSLPLEDAVSLAGFEPT